MLGQLLGERTNLGLKTSLKSSNVPFGRLCGLLLRLFVSLCAWTAIQRSLHILHMIVESAHVSIKCGSPLFLSWWSEIKTIMRPCYQQDDGDLLGSQAMQERCPGRIRLETGLEYGLKMGWEETENSGEIGVRTGITGGENWWWELELMVGTGGGEMS
jgi:hypothetical protein